MRNEERYDDLIDNIKKYGNKKGRYVPRLFDISYPFHSMDFVRCGFSDICPTLSARDYKDPKWVIVKEYIHERN